MSLCHPELDYQTDRQADYKTDRQTDRLLNRHADRLLFSLWLHKHFLFVLLTLGRTNPTRQKPTKARSSPDLPLTAVLVLCRWNMSVSALRLIRCRRLSTAGPPGVRKTIPWKTVREWSAYSAACWQFVVYFSDTFTSKSPGKMARVTGAVVFGWVTVCSEADLQLPLPQSVQLLFIFSLQRLSVHHLRTECSG